MDYDVFCLEMEEHRALKIKEILENILEFCTLRDLKQCRLVSTFWRDSSVAAFKSFPVNLTSSVKTREFVRIMEDPRPPVGSRAQLYSNFHFMGTSLAFTNISAYLWKLCGSHINRLELSSIEFRDVNEFRSIIFNFCSNLKQLALRNIKVIGSTDVAEPTEWQASQYGENKNVKNLTIGQKPGSLGISWMELVNYFPELKILKVQEARYSHHSLFKAVLLTRQHNPNKLLLNEIHFSFAAELYSMMTYRDIRNLVASKVFDLISKTNIQLRALSLDLSGGLSSDNSLILGNILESQGSCLQKLSIRRRVGRILDPKFFHHVNNLVSLENIQELELNYPVFMLMWLVKMMPNLKKLSFSQTNYNIANQGCSMETEYLREIQLKKCVELRLNGCDIHHVLWFGLESLFYLFPNVERLKMPLNNHMFQSVCQRWPNLVEVDIAGGKVDDCGITGMDKDDVERINGQRGGSTWRPITVPRANITCLKHLRKFSMEGSTLRLLSPGSPFATSFLGYCGKLYGFEETPFLEDLSVKFYSLDKKAYKEMFVGNRKINLSTSRL